MKKTPFAVALVATSLLGSSCTSDRPVSTTTDAEVSSVTDVAIEGAQLGFILPDSLPSSRWEPFDRPAIAAACAAAALNCDVQNAQGDKTKMATIADEMLTAKIRVLVIANIDSPSAVAIQEKAAAQGVKLIDYDRLTLRGKTDAYVSFDNRAIGRAQGEGIITCLGGADAARGKRIIQLHGSPTSKDANLWKLGYQQAIKGSGLKSIAEEAVPDSDSERGAQIFEQLLAEAGGKIDGLLVATDGLSLAAQTVLAKAGLSVPVTGQDATRDSLAAILNGTQCMTVHKPARAEAEAAVAAAVTLLKGDAVAANATVYDGARDVPYVQVPVTPIFRDQVKDVVAEGFVTKTELCTGDLVAVCAEAGIE
jgi:D-xylose transport system substrate-binding protein